MRRALPFMLLASCLLDPVGVLNRTELELRAFGLPEGGSVHVTAIDASTAVREKTAKVTNEMMQIFFQEGSLEKGPIAILAEVFDSSGALAGCGHARGVVGEDEVILIGFASPSTSALNCGTCGNRCETDVSVGLCKNGQCTDWQCAPGQVAESDGGCHAPPPPDAGPMDPDAGMMDAGSCTPTGTEVSVASCGDGVDNDCDGFTDCVDPGCLGLIRACVRTNGACTGAGVQTCSGVSWGACVPDDTAEATMTSCKDGVDNDCDGNADCADTACQDIKVACGTDICAAGVKLWNCNLNLLGLTCLPYIALPESNALTCGNNLDDDCDGKIDCINVVGCRGRSCGSGKVCCADGGCSASCL